MPTIRDVVTTILEIESGYASGLKVSLQTAINMVQIIQGDEGDFVIFDNLGDFAFAIVEGAKADLIVDRYLDALYVLRAYRIAGVEIVRFMPFPCKSRCYLEWVPEDAYMDSNPWRELVHLGPG